MQLIFLGSGSAFTFDTENYNSNMLLTDPSIKSILLIDCGSDVRNSLHKLGYGYSDISDVYISHLHADHAGGVEWLGLANKFNTPGIKPNLFTNHNIAHTLWENTLAGGMSTIEGVKASIENFFSIHEIADNDSFVWENITFKTVQTIHVMNDKQLVPSYGLFFTINQKNIFITTDTQFTPKELNQFYLKADIIFHDCETSIRPSGVHSHFNQLIKLDPTIKAKMWLYHYNPGPLPDAQAEGFLGFVKRGQIFDF